MCGLFFRMLAVNTYTTTYGTPVCVHVFSIKGSAGKTAGVTFTLLIELVRTTCFRHFTYRFINTYQIGALFRFPRSRWRYVHGGVRGWHVRHRRRCRHQVRVRGGSRPDSLNIQPIRVLGHVKINKNSIQPIRVWFLGHVKINKNSIQPIRVRFLGHVKIN